MNHLLRATVDLLVAWLRTTKRADLFSRAISLSFPLWIVIGFNSVGLAITIEHGIFTSSCHLYAVQFFMDRTEAAPQVFPMDNTADPDSRSKEYKAIEEQLKALLKELKRMEEKTEEKIRKEILPLIKKEIEKLKKKLREFRSGGDEPEPIET